MARSSRTPWKRQNPRTRAGQASRPLTPAQKSAARARARRAGRPYPNLVDNMRMAAKRKAAKRTSAAKSSRTSSTRKTAAKSSRKRTTKTRKKTTKKKTATKRKARKRAASVREKDPRGGLTAAGRKAFARKQGAHLRPGVTKRDSEMTPQEMRRKGNWAVRFYGRAKLPPLIDAEGRPTRHALSAHAWGEPVPKTVAAARRIAAKGKRLLARYHRLKARA